MTDTLTIKEAAEACGVSQSTIRRSLERFDNAYHFMARCPWWGRVSMFVHVVNKVDVAGT